MLKYGYVLFSILEIITIIIGCLLLISLIILVTQQGNFLEFVNIYPKMIEICIVVILSIVLTTIYFALEYNDKYNINQLKKCCPNIDR